MRIVAVSDTHLKIVIAGNHDRLFEDDPATVLSLDPQTKELQLEMIPAAR